MDKTNNISPVKTAIDATIDGIPAEGVVFYGGAVKAAGISDGKGVLSGYGVVFSTPGQNAQKDLSGQYFTKATYFGPRDGDGCDGAFHHTLPVKGIEGFSEHIWKTPVKAVKDEIGIFCEVVCDMADKYEAAVYKMGTADKLGFSSGTASHMIRCADDGQIKRWPIVEMSLTPTPCEPRARATAMKALEAETGSEAMTKFAGELKAIFESQEQAEEAFVDVVNRNDALDWENDTLRYEAQHQAAIAAIRLDAIRMQADVLRLALMR